MNCVQTLPIHWLTVETKVAYIYMREADHQQGHTLNAGLFMIQRNVDSGMVPLPMFSCLSRWLSKGVFESLMCMPCKHLGLEWTVRFMRA